MKNNSRKAEAGFSLVEVTIAMAIAAVALVTLLGMIPQGMNTMVEATDQAIEARIHQQVLNEIQLTPFEDVGGNSLLVKFKNLEIYYDSQGEELGDSSNSSDNGKGDFEHVYTARVSVMGADPSDGLNTELPPSIGGAGYNGISFDNMQNLDGSGHGNPFVRLVIIEIAAVGGNATTFDFNDPANFSAISTFQTTVVKTGRDFRP